MADKVFIEGRAAVHRGSAGKSIAFPDVCLCPPGPPAGPVPVPFANTVVAADLDGGAPTVLIEGNPMGKRSSFFKQSSGNEAARPTGGGLVSHAARGRAYFQTFSATVSVEGEPAVRHLDLLTHNHLGVHPPNTAPVPWTSTMDVRSVAPSTIMRRAGDGPDRLEIRYEGREDGRRDPVRYVLELSDGRTVEGRLPVGGAVIVTGLAAGSRHRLRFPDRERHARRRPPA
jgi:hypothetical protein